MNDKKLHANLTKFEFGLSQINISWFHVPEQNFSFKFCKLKNANKYVNWV